MCIFLENEIELLLKRENENEYKIVELEVIVKQIESDKESLGMSMCPNLT